MDVWHVRMEQQERQRTVHLQGCVTPTAGERSPLVLTAVAHISSTPPPSTPTGQHTAMSDFPSSFQFLPPLKNKRSPVETQTHSLKLPVLNLPQNNPLAAGRKLRYYSSSRFDIMPSALIGGAQGLERHRVLPVCAPVRLAPRGNGPCPRAWSWAAVPDRARREDKGTAPRSEQCDQQTPQESLLTWL